ncbi:hypothetical protein [uncultured Stenotrophomonas sp.]|uniref:hypothetical protein n=1 Tax=uncultured Stenotrophomonas sp. TaxID=165438 RepID=UPI0025DDAA60|nr:hypothetical protein [uncultured Stenotrophomonas sp.]
MIDDQQRARELLAQEYERDGITHVPDCIRREAMLTEMEHRAIRAITTALRAAPEVIRIPAADGLDPITVYADDLGEGRGRLTVCCYSDSWSYTAAWGAMGGSLHRFIAALNPHYLADNLLWPNAAKARKDQRRYVERIAAAVIAAFVARPQGVKDGS